MSGALPQPGIGCIILAAGEGTRFGEPKAGALVAPGMRFLDRVVATAAAAGVTPIVAVVQPGTEVPPPARGVAARTREQIASMRLGLAQLANTGVAGALVWPVDHPFVELESVLALLDAHRRSGAPITLPTYGGRRGHPVLFARETWPELMVVETGGARGVVNAYRERVHEAAVAGDGVLRDIDTRADLNVEWSSDAIS